MFRQCPQYVAPRKTSLIDLGEPTLSPLLLHRPLSGKIEQRLEKSDKSHLPIFTQEVNVLILLKF